MVAGERPTVADFQEVLGDHGIELRRNGAEWAGPCPLCGGEDRFHVPTTKDTPESGAVGASTGNQKTTATSAMARSWPCCGPGHRRLRP